MDRDEFRDLGRQVGRNWYKVSSRVRKYVIGGVAGVGLIVGSYHSTGTTEVGVRTDKLGWFGKGGVQERVYDPGSTYFFLPIINGWDTYDTRLVNIEMSKNSPEGNTELKFKTIDGNDIGLDIIFSYRIDPKKAAWIRKTVAPDDETLRHKVAEPVLRSRSRDVFGELTTEHFYNAQERGEAADKAKVVLQGIFDKYGLIVEKVDPKDYRFNPNYAEAVADKKKAEIEKLRVESEQKATTERNLANFAQTESAVNKIRADADGAYNRTVVAADAYFTQQQRVANAILAEGRTQADAAIKAREAMMNSGGETYVKMRIAQALQGKKIVMVPVGEGSGLNVQSLDINKFLETQGLRKLADAQLPKKDEQ